MKQELGSRPSAWLQPDSLRQAADLWGDEEPYSEARVDDTGFTADLLVLNVLDYDYNYLRAQNSKPPNRIISY